MERIKGLVICLLAGCCFVCLIIFMVYPQVLLSEEDACAVNSLQSDFSRECDCQGYEYARSQAQYYVEDYQYTEYLAEISPKRSLWKINRDIEGILKKYPLIPAGLFTKYCNKVPADYEN